MTGSADSSRTGRDAVRRTGPGGPDDDPADQPLERDPDEGSLPSDHDVQAERQPDDEGA